MKKEGDSSIINHCAFGGENGAFNKFVKDGPFSDNIENNYLFGGALLGKLLSCDNGVVGTILENLGEERLVFPGVNLSRYFIERLLGNNFEDPLDIFLCKKLDDPEDFSFTFGSPEIIEKGIDKSGLFIDQVEYMYMTFTDSVDESIPIEYHKMFEEVNENNVLSYLYLHYLSYYERQMEKEYFYFVKGFQSMIEVNNRKICIEEDKCLEGPDLSYIIEGGDVDYELFKTVDVSPDPNGSYKKMFLEIVREMYNEIDVDGEKKLEPSPDVAKLLIFWTGSKNFPTSTNNHITN